MIFYTVKLKIRQPCVLYDVCSTPIGRVKSGLENRPLFLLDLFIPALLRLFDQEIRGLEVYGGVFLVIFQTRFGFIALSAFSNAFIGGC